MKTCDVRFSGIDSTCHLLCGLSLCDSGDEPFFMRYVKTSKGDERLDERGKAPVPERSTKNGLSLWNVVEIAEWRRVTVGICDERECGG